MNHEIKNEYNNPAAIKNSSGRYGYAPINADNSYRVTVNETAVSIRFSGEKSLTACLAEALNAMS